MKLRIFTSFGLVAGLAILSSSSNAGVIDPTYQFTNTGGGPVSRADFAIIPSGSVQPPVIGTDPVTGLAITASPVTLDPTRSSGFDPSNFSTALGTGVNVQGLRLLFGQKQVVSNGQVTFVPVNGPNGEAPRYLDNGGVVTFSLHLDPAFQGVVTLKSLTAGIGDATLLPPVGNGSGGDGGDGAGGSGSDGGSDAPNIPEPGTMMLWVAAGAGLFCLRRARPWQASRLRA